jgi:hypothetical protein
MIVGPEGAVFDEAHDKLTRAQTKTAILQADMHSPLSPDWDNDLTTAARQDERIWGLAHL